MSKYQILLVGLRGTDEFLKRIFLLKNMKRKEKFFYT